MDWIVETVFKLLQDILTGKVTDLSKLPALLILIVGVGCFLARKHLWTFLINSKRKIVKYLDIKRLEHKVDAKRARIKQAAQKISDDIERLKQYKKDFSQTREKALQQINQLQPPLNSDSRQLLTKRIQTLEDRYLSSVEMVDEMQRMIDAAINIDRAEELNTQSRKVASRLVRRGRERIQAQQHSQKNQ